MLSICITVKNRSRVRAEGRELQLFPNCVRSLAQAVQGLGPCELVVADWQSDDWPLNEWLPKLAAPLSTTITQIKGSFSRGAGLNQAARCARGDTLFFADADALFGGNVLQRGLACAQTQRAYFPVLFSYADPGHRTGWWRHSGFGHCCLHRGIFEQTRGWPIYRKWGKEDVEFHERVEALCPVIREEVHEFYHQWHPEDLLWKDRYSENIQALQQDREMALHTWGELARVVPPGATVILVDEARLGGDPEEKRPTLAFTEKAGSYWGPPEDDTHAIHELERLRLLGGQFLAVSSLAGWWLDYYRGWSDHLHRNYTPVLQTERLVVFDLRHTMPASRPSC